MDRRSVGEELGSLVRAGLELVLPRECAGCGRSDRALCGACLRRFGTPVRCEHQTQHLDGTGGAPPLPTWALAAYSGPVRHAVLAWKSGGRPDLAAPLTRLAGQAAGTLAPALHLGTGAALVVPAPSAAARRRSGTFVVGELADAVGLGLAEGLGRRVAVVDPLRRRESASHLLGAAARSSDRAGAVRCLVDMPATTCLLVDDVVTTGATLAACEAALRAAGARVAGALVLARTPPPGATAEVPDDAPELARPDGRPGHLRGT